MNVMCHTVPYNTCFTLAEFGPSLTFFVHTEPGGGLHFRSPTPTTQFCPVKSDQSTSGDLGGARQTILRLVSSATLELGKR